ncbi:MAG: PstS family phosphate ABC transporter substrate-binding protein [Thermomicrobiales bacterium]
MLRFRTRMRGGASLASLVAFIAMFALSPMVTLAQDATPGAELAPYEAPDNIGDLEGEISSAGSSTVAPVTNAMIEQFAGVAPNVQIANQTTGTGGGFELFCGGETQIQNASRPIAADEIQACADAGIDYYVFTVGLDGIAFVTNPDNAFLECLTVEQVSEIYQVDSEITTWDQVDPSFPAEPVDIYGPDPDSGTYDYMAEVVEDTTGAEGLRSDQTQSVDDNVLVEGVAGSENSIGYFGYAYFEQNQDRLKEIAIDSGDGCVEPSAETVTSGEYAPFARPLFIYVRADALEDEAVQEFVRFYIANAPEIVPQVGYFQAAADVYTEAQAKAEAAIAGEAEPDSQSMGTPAA